MITKNDEANILTKLIITLENVSDAQRDSTKTQKELRQGLGELTGVVHEQSEAIRDLTQIVAVDRQTSEAADKKLNERIDRMAQESGRKVVARALKYLIPILTMLGMTLAWIISNGPAALREWVLLYNTLHIQP